MTEFLAMGGYAAYVWPAIAVAALVMAVLYVQSRRVLRAREAALEALQRARSGGDAARDAAHADDNDEA